MKIKTSKEIVTTLICAAITLSASTALADHADHNDFRGLESTNPNLDALTVVSTLSSVNGFIAGFRCADGSVTGDPADACGVQSIIYPISGKVYAPIVSPVNGKTVGAVAQIGTIDATPELDPGYFALGDPTVDWTTLPVLPWTMSTLSMKVGGSTFTYIEGMELNGSAYAPLGPVEIPNPENGASLRMAGCQGVHEVSGIGQYANMIGSLCLNGTFSFQPNFDGKGISNCTLVLHDQWLQ